jgi:hypothetical protein
MIEAGSADHSEVGFREVLEVDDAQSIPRSHSVPQRDAGAGSIHLDGLGILGEVTIGRAKG